MGSPGRIRHVGGYGAGYTAKLLVNLLWFGQAVATAEALLLGRASGLDLGVLREVLADSAAGSDFIRRDLDALFAGDFMRTFGLDRCCEELHIVTGLAHGHHLPFQVSESVAELYRQALGRYGPADGELLGVALLEEQAGLRLRHPPAADKPDDPARQRAGDRPLASTKITAQPAGRATGAAPAGRSARARWSSWSSSGILGLIEGRGDKRLREDLGMAGRRQFEIPGFEIAGPGACVRKSAGEEICVAAGRRIETAAAQGLVQRCSAAQRGTHNSTALASKQTPCAARPAAPGHTGK